MYLSWETTQGRLCGLVKKTLQSIGVVFVYVVGFLFFGPTVTLAQVPTLSIASTTATTATTATLNGTITTGGNSLFTRGFIYSTDPTFATGVATSSETTLYDISTATFNTIALSVAAQETFPNAMLFNATGSVLYVMGSNGDDINAYTLSTPYDISTATFSNIALSVAAQEIVPHAMLFNNTGSVLYVMGDSGGNINAYTLGTPYSTGSFSRSVTGLTPDTVYYVRAFAQNSQGVGYSTTNSFTAAVNIRLGNHTTGQVSNVFSSQDKTNEVLFAFQTRASSSITVNNIQFDLEGVNQISLTELVNLRLYQDVNNNRVFNSGTDLQVGGTGVMSLSGETGTIVFTNSFVLATSTELILVGDTNGIDGGDSVIINLRVNKITFATSAGSIGSVDPVQHVRNNRGGGGSSVIVGVEAPVGNGEVRGGQTGGAGGTSAIDTNTGGAMLPTNTDFRRPTSDSGSWVTPANAYNTTDGTYATDNVGATHNFTAFGFTIPPSNIVNGISVELEVSGVPAAGTIGVELSYNGGIDWTSTGKVTSTLTGTDAVVSIGGPSDLWGRTWTLAEFSNANFAVRLTGNPNSNTVRVDGFQVRIYNQSTGGSQGGGGET